MKSLNENGVVAADALNDQTITFDSLCPLNGVKEDIIIFMSRSLHGFACHLEVNSRTNRPDLR